MAHPGESWRPSVFLSFAGPDRPQAKNLGQCLHPHGFDPFVDRWSIAPGENLVFAINDAIAQSDYFVLLWSQHSVDNRWVRAELSAALMRDLSEVGRRRCFLFVVCLDSTPLPVLVSARSYLDAEHGWEAVAEQLVRTWQRDLAVGLPVLPAPHPAPADAGPTVECYVRNRDLSVTHVVRTAASTTGWGLQRRVRDRLGLKDIVTELDGQVGIRLRYQLVRDGQPIAADEALTIREYSLIDLRVTVEPFGPTGPLTASTYMGGEHPTLNRSMLRALTSSAFGHLRPHPMPPLRLGSASNR